MNKFETTEPTPLTADLDAAIQTVDPEVERAAIDAAQAWRAERDNDAVARRARRPARRRQDRRQPDGGDPRVRPRRA